MLYNAVTIVLLATEGFRLGAAGQDARRLLFARFVLEHRMHQGNQMNINALRWEEEAISLVLSDAAVPLGTATALLLA